MKCALSRRHKINFADSQRHIRPAAEAVQSRGDTAGEKRARARAQGCHRSISSHAMIGQDGVGSLRIAQETLQSRN